MMDARLTSLIDVGFTEKEARIFTALSELETATASTIAESAKLKRPIVYLILEKLVKQGMVREIPNQRVKRYASIEPIKLVHVLQANVENLRTMLPLFRAFQKQKNGGPSIEIFENPEAISSVFRMLEQGKVCRYVSSYSRIKNNFPTEIERWAARGADSKYKNDSKHLCVDEPEARALAQTMAGNPKQQFRFLPAGSILAMDLSLSDDILAITSFDPLFSIVLRSSELADSMAIVFDLAWAMQKGQASA